VNRTRIIGVFMHAFVLPVALPGQELPQGAGLASAGAPPPAANVDSLVALALAVNPEIRAARARTEAARARIGPAGTLPDPMLGVGIMNLPVSEPAYGDMMTMNALAVGQLFPFPGKLSLARRIAEQELAATEARLRAVQLEVAARVRQSYYDVAFLDHALEVLQRNQTLLVNFIQVTESRYGVGTGGQHDVLKARVEAARLAGEAVALTEQRGAALARLNALLARASATPVANTRIPERVARAAVAGPASAIRFTSSALGARAADSPFPPVEQLQERAIRDSPVLRAHELEIGAQAMRLDLAGKAHLPDFDVSLQYGQRVDRPDMLSVMVSAPVPLRKGSRQDPAVTEARAKLAALQAERDAMVNRLRADIAERYAELERTRAQLALFVKSIIPQGRAALESATAAFQVARADFLTLLENQMTLFDYETGYFRALVDFAKNLAELERIVGQEVLS
jgi:outer membrane protein, heavy metal efflux system